MKETDDWYEAAKGVPEGHTGAGRKLAAELVKAMTAAQEPPPVTIEVRVTVRSGEEGLRREIAIALERRQADRLCYHAANLAEEMIIETSLELLKKLKEES